MKGAVVIVFMLGVAVIGTAIMAFWPELESTNLQDLEPQADAEHPYTLVDSTKEDVAYRLNPDKSGEEGELGDAATGAAEDKGNDKPTPPLTYEVSPPHLIRNREFDRKLA